MDKLNNDKLINETIQLLHSKLHLKYGNKLDELPEQKMVVRYLKGT